MPSHKISNSNDIRSGNANSADRTKSGVPLVGEVGNVVVIDLGTPAVEDPNGLIESFTTVGADADVAMDGAVADANVDANGDIVLDVPRNITVDSGGADDAVVTITGFDVYGVLMVETILMNATTEVVGKKAFKKVRSIGVSKAVANGGIVGIGKALGLPYRPVRGGFISGIANENTSDAGTFVAPERTTSTATTADVRGTYAGAGTYDGSLRISVRVALNNGPDDAGGFGIAQYAG
jgi:hypothetical protein